MDRPNLGRTNNESMSALQSVWLASTVDRIVAETCIEPLLQDALNACMNCQIVKCGQHRILREPSSLNSDIILVRQCSMV